MKHKLTANAAYKNSTMGIASMNVYEVLAWVSVAAVLVFIVAVVAGCLKVLGDHKLDDDDDCGV